MLEMKDGFTSAVKAMGEVQYGDRVLQDKVDNNKAEQDEQLADVVNMVLALKVTLHACPNKNFRFGV